MRKGDKAMNKILKILGVGRGADGCGECVRSESSVMPKQHQKTEKLLKRYTYTYPSQMRGNFG